MKQSVQESIDCYQKLQKQLHDLQQEHGQLAIGKRPHFIQQIYFPQMFEASLQKSIHLFELRFPLGNDAHTKAYFEIHFQKLNHFF